MSDINKALTTVLSTTMRVKQDDGSFLPLFPVNTANEVYVDIDNDVKLSEYLNSIEQVGDIITELPVANKSYSKKIYFIVSGDNSERYNAYVCVNKGTETTENWQWVLVGSVNASIYATDYNIENREAYLANTNEASSVKFVQSALDGTLDAVSKIIEETLGEDDLTPDALVVSEEPPTNPNESTIWLKPTSVSTGAVDFIVEQGTSGIWTYRKWESGLVECWGTYEATSGINVSKNNFQGSYYSDGITVTLPVPFTSILSFIASGGSASNIHWARPYYTNVSSNTVAFMLITNASNQNNAGTVVGLEVKGTWK